MQTLHCGQMEKWWCRHRAGDRGVSAFRIISGSLQRHRGHKMRSFSKGLALGYAICPRSHIPPTRLPSCCVLYFYLFLWLQTNLSLTSLILNFSSLFDQVPSTYPVCSTLYLKRHATCKEGRERGTNAISKIL